MYMTIEEMYAFKNKYEQEILELQRKKAVVDEFIAFAEAKECDKSDEQIQSEDAETDYEQQENSETENY